MMRSHVGLVLWLIGSLVAAASAEEKSAESPSDDYTAYWLVSDQRGVQEEYGFLLLTRISLTELRQYQSLRQSALELNSRKRAPLNDFLLVDVPLLDSPAIVLRTYGKDSVWNDDGGAIRPVGRISAYDARARKITIDSIVYRIEDATIKQAVHLLEHPQGTISLHRRRGPLSGFEHTAKALTLRLQEQQEEPQQKPENKQEHAAEEPANPDAHSGVEVFLAIVSLDAAEVDPQWLRSEVTWFSYRPDDTKGLGVALIVRNGAEKALQLPRKFDSKALRLLGAGVDGHVLQLLSTSPHDPSDTVEIGPGETKFAFNLSLYDVMEQPAVDPTPPTRRTWVWGWRAHPKPPPSPAYYRHGGHVESAMLWAELKLGGQIYRTAPKTLRVSDAGPP